MISDRIILFLDMTDKFKNIFLLQIKEVIKYSKVHIKNSHSKDKIIIIIEIKIIITIIIEMIMIMIIIVVQFL